jgi:hypothetical protein
MDNAGGSFPPASPYWRAVEEIFRRIQARIPETLPEPVIAYLAGGAAVHYYLGARVTRDVDVEFSKRLLIQGEITVVYQDENGRQRTVYWDRNYHSALGLMHADFHDDARIIGSFGPHLILKILSPLDLAVSKLARFQDHDRTDIEGLALAGLIGSEELARRAERAEEALADYIGHDFFVRRNIHDAVQCIRRIERGEQHGPG